MRNLAFLGLLCAGLVHTGIAVPGAAISIPGIPHVQQKPDFCGEACAEMVLRKLGHDISQNDVFNAAGLDPVLGRGCYTPELKRALAALGFKTGQTWYVVPADKPPAVRDQWKVLHGDLTKGVPSIVCMRAGTNEHFRLVVGYDPGKDTVLYHEPAAAEGAYRELALDKFLDAWPLKYKRKRWTIVRLRMEPGTIAERPAIAGFSAADYAQHIMQLREKIGKDSGFTVVVQKPFVVIGDENPKAVRLRAERTVKWATKRLKDLYFDKDPADIIDIWLFKDKASYRKHTWELFRDRPDTPFGYASSTHHALIMNIATGGGTLVHEIVHPFVDANFPSCPAWFNEGLGSLYEQSSARNGRIVGLTNWRLDGLQKAIRRKSVPSFKTLTGTSTREFYDEDLGTNYAQARYLCYYLQEKGLLKGFYHTFRRNATEDPSGYRTLKNVLGVEDMGAFKAQWEAYVLKLRFP
ncbi:MAG: hypothetical protein HN742_01505 [Lentisphaerae bacterium]|jgi:hypothetical protein|nr:hypothetical protein [Lentisphaerota bacterium]MBT4814430.1 hypothetical protein [Lentisphaerota bacterium]MBT5611055.1 hypothetical protein [Lentisphaerota bacterium]MBT7053890.1 hypothetical protein [Lentisphaerota bacterium]MBT7840511.1 hypothetical protein [Lentisphaerota bacterium]